jgi:hypothetical protein
MAFSVQQSSNLWLPVLATTNGGADFRVNHAVARIGNPATGSGKINYDSEGFHVCLSKQIVFSARYKRRSI